MVIYISIISIILLLIGIIFSFISRLLWIGLHNRNIERREWALDTLQTALEKLKSEKEEDVIIACHKLGALADFTDESDKIVKELDSLFVSPKWKSNSRVIGYVAATSSKLMQE